VGRHYFIAVISHLAIVTAAHEEIQARTPAERAMAMGQTAAEPAIITGIDKKEITHG
jgi:hypothetical protein